MNKWYCLENRGAITYKSGNAIAIKIPFTRPNEIRIVESIAPI